MNDVIQINQLVKKYQNFQLGPLTISIPRGMIIGLDMAENLESMAKIYLAVLDSICFGTRHIIEVARNNGYKINSIIVCGGAVKNSLYMQELADICCQDIYFAGHDEAVVLGSAINASIASGIYPTYKEALSNMGKLGDIVKPNKELSNYYNKKYEIYLDMFNDKLKYENIMKDF